VGPRNYALGGVLSPEGSGISGLCELLKKVAHTQFKYRAYCSGADPVSW